MASQGEGRDPEEISWREKFLPGLRTQANERDEGNPLKTLFTTRQNGGGKKTTKRAAAALKKREIASKKTKMEEE